MNRIAEQITSLKTAISEFASSLGRNPESIVLLAVTKLADAGMIKQAYDAGHRDFGENYMQKIIPKMDVLPSDIGWHFIGEVQKNKINKILGKFKLIHTIDSIHIAEEINKRAGRDSIIQNILIEVNASGETAKHGIEIVRAEELALFISDQCEFLKLLGLMTVAPFTDDKKTIAKCFADVQRIKINLENQGLELPHLSMGMTNDWRIALEYGATILRIGTAIFG